MTNKSFQANISLLAIAAAALITLPTNALAQVSKCTDATGKVTYQADPCPQSVKAESLDVPSKARAAPIYESKMVCAPTDAIAAKQDTMIARARSEIESVLKDPFSAKAALVYARLDCSDGLRHAVCGIVNAKNSYGGYAGNKIWLYSVDAKDRSFLWQQNEDAKGAKEIYANLDTLKIATACLRAGVK